MNNQTGVKRETRIITLLAETFLHPGTGQTTGVVDLPIQRERHTNFPMIQSTGLKGSLRDLSEQKWGKGSKDIEVIFGPDAQGADSGAGALAITDARILAYPVRSLQQVFVWITCPMVLRKLQRDLKLAGLPVTIPIKEANSGSCKTTKTTNNKFEPPLVLEELSFDIETERIDDIAQAIAGLCPGEIAADLTNRLVLVNDDDFKYLVTYATQVSARIKLNERKTTTGNGGNLWYEETLPPETLMYALLLAQTPRIKNNGSGIADAKGVIDKFTANNVGLFPNNQGYLQIGGNETVGQGWCSVRFSNGGAK